MKAAAVRFRRESILEGGSYHLFQIAVCGGCGFQDRVRDSTRHSAPPEMIRRKFMQRGWAMGSKATDDQCPRCSEKASGRRTAAKQTPKPKEPIMAEAPRQPSKEDRARIREALFSHYDEAADRYTGAASDRALGEKLNVPFAWVSQTREAMGFGPDRNEAQEAHAAAVVEMRAALKKAEDDFLAATSAIDARLKQVERGGYKAAA